MKLRTENHPRCWRKETSVPFLSGEIVTESWRLLSQHWVPWCPWKEHGCVPLRVLQSFLSSGLKDISTVILLTTGAMDSLFFGKHCYEVFLLPFCSHSNRCWVIPGCQTPPLEGDFVKNLMSYPGQVRKVLLTILVSFIAMVFQKKFICPNISLPTMWESVSHTQTLVSILRISGKIMIGAMTHKMLLGSSQSSQLP